MIYELDGYSQNLTLIKNNKYIHLHKVKQLRVEFTINDYNSNSKYLSDNKLIERNRKQIDKTKFEKIKEEINNKFKKNETLLVYISSEYIECEKDLYRRTIRVVANFHLFIFKKYKILEDINVFDKQIEAQKNKGFMSKLINGDYQKQKEEYIDEAIEVYLNFFKKSMQEFKLPIYIVDSLKEDLILSLRFNIVKTFTIADEITEKIYEFLDESKDLSALEREYLINECIDDFTQFFEKKSLELKNFKNNKNQMEIIDEISYNSLDKINNIKGKLFK